MHSCGFTVTGNMHSCCDFIVTLPIFYQDCVNSQNCRNWTTHNVCIHSSQCTIVHKFKAWEVIKVSTLQKWSNNFAHYSWNTGWGELGTGRGAGRRTKVCTLPLNSTDKSPQISAEKDILQQTCFLEQCSYNFLIRLNVVYSFFNS